MNENFGANRWDIFVYGIYACVVLAFAGYYLYLRVLKKRLEDEA